VWPRIWPRGQAAGYALGSSRIDVFVRGTDGAIYEKTTTNSGSSWGGWVSLGGQIPVNTVPAACSWGAGRLDLFAYGTDGQMWWKYTTNGGSSWSGWHSLGGKLAPHTGPGVDEALHLFVQGTDNQLWFWNGGAAWRTLGGAPPEALSTSSPSAGLPPNDHSVVCVSSTSGNVWSSTISLTGVWDQWDSAGSPP